MTSIPEDEQPNFVLHAALVNHVLAGLQTQVDHLFKSLTAALFILAVQFVIIAALIWVVARS